MTKRRMPAWLCRLWGPSPTMVVRAFIQELARGISSGSVRRAFGERSRPYFEISIMVGQRARGPQATAQTVQMLNLCSTARLGCATDGWEERSIAHVPWPNPQKWRSKGWNGSC